MTKAQLLRDVIIKKKDRLSILQPMVDDLKRELEFLIKDLQETEASDSRKAKKEAKKAVEVIK